MATKHPSAKTKPLVSSILLWMRTDQPRQLGMDCWDTPNVAHDNPTDQRFNASLMLGFVDVNVLRAFFGGEQVATLSRTLPELVSAVHAYEANEALTYVKDGKVLPQVQV